MSWWSPISNGSLAQGDLLPACLSPVFRANPVPNETGEADEEDVFQADLIIVTQTCDLENHKAEFVALCPIHALAAFEEINPKYQRKGEWEAVRKGRVDGLHLLASPVAPDDNRAALVVDFGHIVSLPVEYLTSHAETLEHRWRLTSPFLEHFSQAFARFFMRVGLPSSIASYR
jgi:hypothetical protein